MLERWETVDHRRRHALWRWHLRTSPLPSYMAGRRRTGKTLGFLVLRWLLRRVLEWLGLKMPMSELHSFQPFGWQGEFSWESTMVLVAGAGTSSCTPRPHAMRHAKPWDTNTGSETRGRWWTHQGRSTDRHSRVGADSGEAVSAVLACAWFSGTLLRPPAQLGWKSKTTPIKQNLWDKFSSTLPISIWCETPWQWGSLVTCLQVHC